MFVIPPFLRPGSIIGITCPAGFVSQERVAFCVEVLQRWGFKVKLGSTVGTEHHYFSGTDNERLADLQNLLDDPTVDAILMGRGGYGTSRIIDALDFSRFVQKPKWISGFSDITVLHSHIQSHYGIATLHSAMCGAFRPETETSTHVQSILKAWTGQDLEYHTPVDSHNRTGKTKGILIGGNLAILAHLTGSSSQVDTSGKILFIEDVGEYRYNLDRLLLNLKRSGQLDELAGLVVGSFTDVQDTERPFGQEVKDLILDKVREYDYPVCFDFPAGHQEENHALRFGMVHQLEVTEAGAILTNGTMLLP